MRATASVADLHALALGQLRRDEFASAALTLRRLLMTIGPRHESRAGVLVTLAFAHLMAGDADEAARVARAAMTLDPTNGHARDQLRRAELARNAS